MQIKLYVQLATSIGIVITAPQFRACLDEHLDLKLSDEDFEHLVQKYGQEKEGRINYKEFVHVLENCNSIHCMEEAPGSFNIEFP